MSEEIFNYIIERARSNGFEVKHRYATSDSGYILSSNDSKIVIDRYELSPYWLFEYWGEEMTPYLFSRIAKFIIPESLDDLKELFRILKIFEP